MNFNEEINKLINYTENKHYIKFTDKYPLITMLLYIGLLIYVLYNLKENYKKLKLRKNTDFYTILIILLLFIGIHSFFYTTEHIVKFEKKTIEKYKQLKKIKEQLIYELKNNDIYQNDPKIIEKQLKTINNLDSEMKNIETELLNHSKVETQNEIISELNKGYDRKLTKSDIYIEYENKEIKGVSVKQNAKATKSNYSVQKMLSKENDKILTNIKKTFLKENGYTRSDKTKRDNMNKLFYNNNPYWQALKTEIEINKSVILQQLLKLLYCCNMKYDVYEYDGTTLKKLNIKIEDISSVVFEEYLQYYYDTKGNKRETAKLFYRLCVDKKIYRVEIRWKGDIYNASPQFQIHNECPINSSLKSS